MDYPRILKAEVAALGSPSAFRHDGGSLTDFIGNVMKPGDDEYTIVGKLFGYFCLADDGSYNGFSLGVKLCVGFITNCAQLPPAELIQPIRDLGTIVKSSPSKKAVEDWARSNFRRERR